MEIEQSVQVRRSGLAALTLAAVLPAAACSDDDPGAARRLTTRDFDAAIVEVCGEHGRALDDLFEGIEDAASIESDADFEPLRQSLIELKRDLVEQLRGIEPADRAESWEDAIDGYEEAIDTAAAGPLVDVRAEGLDSATNRLVDEFGLEGCF